MSDRSLIVPKPALLRLTATAVAVLAVPDLLTGCSEKEKTPAEQRRERVERRLLLSFTDEQVDCMLDRIDSQLMAALDRESGLPEGQTLIDYTEAARECVVAEGTATTTSQTSNVPPQTDSTDSTQPQASNPTAEEGATTSAP